jgi:hypothetical protein
MKEIEEEIQVNFKSADILADNLSDDFRINNMKKVWVNGKEGAIEAEFKGIAKEIRYYPYLGTSEIFEVTNGKFKGILN